MFRRVSAAVADFRSTTVTMVPHWTTTKEVFGNRLRSFRSREARSLLIATLPIRTTKTTKTTRPGGEGTSTVAITATAGDYVILFRLFGRGGKRTKVVPMCLYGDRHHVRSNYFVAAPAAHAYSRLCRWVPATIIKSIQLLSLYRRYSSCYTEDTS